MMDAPVVDLNTLLELHSWDRAAYEQVQRIAFTDDKSGEQFKSRLGQLERDAITQTGDVPALALKIGLGRRLLGDPKSAAEWLAKARPSAIRDFFYGRVLRDLGQLNEALAAFDRAASGGWDAMECACERAVTLLMKPDVSAAEAVIREQSTAGASSGLWYYAMGRLHEARGEIESAMDAYERAAQLEPECGTILFRLAFVSDLYGNDERALDLYEACASLPVVSANALMNLAVICEDLGDFDHAKACLQRVLAIHPNHARARLFLKDVEASQNMIIDEEQERLAHERSTVLETPISDFELSVRARNCLKKMNINTLGDLLRISEAELLAYKNFGETSLNEIKAMLAQKGLQLGQHLDPNRTRPEFRRAPVQGNPEQLSRPVAELELSVRSRKCLQRLNITTVGELCSRTEQELLATRNFGQTSLNEIKRRLGELGLTLRRIND